MLVAVLVYDLPEIGLNAASASSSDQGTTTWGVPEAAATSALSC